MSETGVSFEDENQLARQTSGAQSPHFMGMSGWLVRKGLAANQTSADLTLVVLAVAISLISYFLYSYLQPSFPQKTNTTGVIPENISAMQKTAGSPTARGL